MAVKTKAQVTNPTAPPGLGGVFTKRTTESRVLRIVEKLLALFLALLVVWGAVVLVMSVPWFHLPENMDVLHKVLEQVLSDILLLVVTLELAIMLIYRKIEYLLDVMLFVVARKMLIGVTETTDVAIGVAALAALFAVRKYLLLCPGCTIVDSAADEENIKR